MLCPKCNEEVREGLKFCSKCGKNIDESKKNQNKLIINIILWVIFFPIMLIIFIIKKNISPRKKAIYISLVIIAMVLICIYSTVTYYKRQESLIISCYNQSTFNKFEELELLSSIYGFDDADTTCETLNITNDENDEIIITIDNENLISIYIQTNTDNLFIYDSTNENNIYDFNTLEILEYSEINKDDSEEIAEDELLENELVNNNQEIQTVYYLNYNELGEYGVYQEYEGSDSIFYYFPDGEYSIELVNNETWYCYLWIDYNEKISSNDSYTYNLKQKLDFSNMTSTTITLDSDTHIYNSNKCDYTLTKLD